MGLVKGFLEIERKERPYDKVEARLKTWKEFVRPLPAAEVARQGARCMDCGIPFCHNGCPVNNIIPEWNELVRRDRWRDALEVLHSTNNFPEFTGRICPAPCEASCTLNIDDNPVTIKSIECAICGRGWAEGWVKSLLEGYDAVALTGGAEEPRNLAVPGRELDGIHFAMDFLVAQNKGVAGDDEARAAPKGTISAKDKHVVVIGGGDTGSDCVGTSNRMEAASVTQLEVMPQPPEQENKALTWPDWPLKMRTSSSHEEGVERDFAVLTKRAVGANGRVEALECVRVAWIGGAMKEVPDSTF